MTPLEFLAVVLPSPDLGFYCAAGFKNHIKRHKFVKEIDQLEDTVTSWHKEGLDCYFALSVFEKTGSRKAENARHIKSLFVDLDGYPTKKEAIEALNNFMAKTGLDMLGTPYVTDSGGGVHVYWPLIETVTIEQWKPIADAFKRLFVQENMRIDMSVTADAARVLRIPGTSNFKKKYGATPRPTRILVDEGDTFDFDALSAHILSVLHKPAPALPAVQTLQLPGVRPTSKKPSASAVQLFQNHVTKFGIIYKKTKEGKGCGQLRHYVEHASEDGMEPLWRATLSIAQKCEEAPKAVVWLSELHPYDLDRMNQKLAEIKGPYSCTAFDSINPGICTDCEHWGRITNPLALGRDIATTVETKEISLDPQGDKTETVLRPEPPRGYAYGQNGGVYIEREDIDDQGVITKRLQLLLPYDVFPIDLLNNNGSHLVRMLAVRRNAINEIVLPQEALAGRAETIKCLMNQNIVAANHSANDKLLHEYVRACVEKLSLERRPVDVPQYCGWQPDNSFVYAETIYRKDDKPLKIPMKGLENITMNARSEGSLDEWKKIAQMLVRRNMWSHLSIMLFGIGSPLMRFTKLDGATVHCTSSESGTGKSFALNVAASVWGHPIHYRTGAGTSPVAMQQRLGLLHSLPLITDEITTNNRNDFEWFTAFLLSMSEGRGKERMENGANKERLNLSVWSALALMSSNRPAVDYMTGVRDHSSQGELLRLLEYSMDEKLQWDDEEVEIVKSLTENFGVLGEVLAQYFVDNREYVQKLVQDTFKRLTKDIGKHSDERYWIATCTVAMVAGVLLNSKHLNIVDIPMQEILNDLDKHVAYMRACTRGGKRTAEDVLNSYIQEYQGQLVVVKFGEKAGPLAHFNDGAAVGKTTTKSQVMGRVEHGVTAGHVDLYIEERLLKSYCSNRSFSYSMFKRQLEENHVIGYQPKKDMLAKTDAPPMRVAVMKISRKVTEHEEVIGSPLPVEKT